MSARRPRAAAALALLAAAALALAPPRTASAATAPDSLVGPRVPMVIVVDSLARPVATAADSLVGPTAPAAADSAALARAAAAGADTTGAPAPPPKPARATVATGTPRRGEPPLNISADNVSGSHDESGDIVLLHGHVRITRERTVLTAEDGRYLRTEGMLYLDGHVHMVDSTATVTCDHASYSEHNDVLDLAGNVVVTDRNGTLRAPSGTYDRRRGRALLVGGVTGQDGNQHLTCDQATWVRDSSLVQARGRVRGEDPVNKVTLEAESIDYDREHRVAIATQSPVMHATDRDGRTVTMRAMKLRLNTATRVAEATDSVSVVRDTLQATADRAVFDDLHDHGWLFGRPRVWDNETSVSGDSIEVHTDHRVLQRVLVRHNAVMDYQGAKPTTVGEASTLTGQGIEMFFTRQALDSLVATGDARNEYRAVPRAGQTQETNTATGDTITVFFKDRKIERARVHGRAQGEYHLAVAEKDTTAAKRERVSYDARRIEFVVAKSRIVLDDEAHLVYQDLVLRSRRVEFDVDQQTLVAEGNPQLLERGDKVTGHLMTYDLESRVGTIYQAETAYERGLYHGERIRKAGDNELDVMNGAYSTCDLPSPHYHFAAHWMKIYLKDKLVAKPVVFYIKNVPILALPFWIFPIKPGRHSGFIFPQFELGLNNRAGQFVRNAGYYWAPNDYMDLTASGDYYQAEPSWVVRGEGEYKLLYALDGSFRGSYARDEGISQKQENWDFSADHAQTLSPRTRLVARAQFVSNRAYSGSPLFGNTLSDRLNRFLTSSFALSHSADWASFSAVVDRREDIDADAFLEDPDGAGPAHGPPVGTLASLPNLTQSEPAFSVSFPTRTLGSMAGLKGTPLGKSLSTVYFSLSSQFLSLRQRQAYVAGEQYFNGPTGPDSSNVLGQLLSVRRAMSSATSLSDSRRMFGWLNFAPRINSNLVVFDHDELGHKVVPAATWNAGLSMGTSYYGTFHPQIGSLVGLRHVVAPSVSFSYSPAFDYLTFPDSVGVRHNRFQGFSGIGVSGFKSARLDFGIDQRLQAKLKSGDQVRRLDNLLTFVTASSYDLLYKEDGLKHGLSPLSSNLQLQPPGVVNAGVAFVTDVYEGRPLRSLSYNLNLNLASSRRSNAGPELPVDRTVRGTVPDFQDNWSLGFAYSYAGGYAGPEWSNQQNVNAVARAQLTPSWGFEYSTSYDVTLHQVGSQRFALTRDLHCWQASFTRTFVVGGEAEYYFRLGVKDQRELYIERGTRQGSLGGLQ